MKLIDGDALLDHVRSRMVREPDYDTFDAECDIDDAEELDLDDIIPQSEAFRTGAEWALAQVEKDIADRIRARLRG